MFFRIHTTLDFFNKYPVNIPLITIFKENCSIKYINLSLFNNLGDSMRKTIVLVGVLVIFMLVAISFSTAINSNKATETKESPLYKIRTNRAVAERIDTILENMKTKFLGERAFCIPITLFRIVQYTGEEYYSCTDCSGITCQATACILEACTNDFGCTSKTCDVVTSPITCSQFSCFSGFCGCDS